MKTIFETEGQVPAIGLEPLSTFDLDPIGLIRVAADLSVGAVSLNLSGAANSLSGSPRRKLGDDPSRLFDIRNALAETGIGLTIAEGIGFGASDDVTDFKQALDQAAELGARLVCIIGVGRDRMRMAAQFHRLAELTAERGLVLVTEVGAGSARTLSDSVSLAHQIGHGNFGLLLDCMHFFRSGAAIADLATFDPALIRHVQLCDVPMPAVMPSYAEEALFERRAPGDGDLPLREFVRHIPDHATIGLEIPIRSLAARGMSHRDRLEYCLAKANALWL